MFKRKFSWLKIGLFLLALAPELINRACIAGVGEPEIPTRYKK